MSSTARRRPVRLAVITGAAVATVLVAGGCAKSASNQASDSPSGGSKAAGQQRVADAGSKGPTCTAKQYGAPKVDLKKVTIGFSQSESTSNPFRATETKSITDEAKRLGIKPLDQDGKPPRRIYRRADAMKLLELVLAIGGLGAKAEAEAREILAADGQLGE